MRRALLPTVLLSLLAESEARANGRFPNAQEFHQAPGSNRNLMVVRVTFGLLVSFDRGQRWEYWCEDALQYGDGYDPPLSYAADGTLLVALQDGLVTTRDGCTFRSQPDLESLTVRDLAATPDGGVTWAVTLTRNARPDSRVARSTDNGATFQFVGERLADTVLDTIEVAPSDPQRLYASGTVNQEVALFRSDDGGLRWARAPARFGGATGVYVSGVDPRDPDVLYLRATAAPEGMDAGSADGSGVLFRSEDGGGTLRVVFRSAGPMRGFALSDDGRRVWAGGPDDGVWRMDDGAAPTRLSGEPVECLRWSDGALWACRTFERGGPLLVRSDGAGPFVTALAATDIAGPPSRCPAGTLNRDICPGRWRVARGTLVPAPAMDASAGRGAAPPAPRPSDCACRSAHADPNRGRTSFMWIAAVWIAVRRRRAR
ncbi:MAG: hypothetical protein EPO40_25195 [Myxococcaceae bacterium]|nr:MAG: hypothetical protein EPO40_25195 [Myxococcaceae bacterium]